MESRQNLMSVSHLTHVCHFWWLMRPKSRLFAVAAAIASQEVSHLAIPSLL
jgi:hypothetical protein